MDAVLILVIAVLVLVLAFTETATLSRRWQDVNEIVGRAIDGCRNELDAAGVRVQTERSERLPLVYVDGRQLEKVIAMLLVRPAPRSAPPCDIAAVTLATRKAGGTDERLVIDLDDRAAADLDDEPSWWSDLAACRRIVEAHGGTLDVLHPPHGGYRCHLELPVTASGKHSAMATAG